MEEYNETIGLELEWQSMDGFIIQAPVRSKKEADEGLDSNPTDRGRCGSKIHLHVDQHGIPIGILAVGGNVHDSRLVGLTFEKNADIADYYDVCAGLYNLCLDKGYDFERVHSEIFVYGLEPHIRSRGEDKHDQQEDKHPPRRWVVERTFAWLKGYRTVRTRYCRHLSNFFGCINLACAIMIFRKIK